jgi:hypothetical protein
MLRRAFVASILVLAACDQITAAPEPGLAGTYTLRTVNGAPLLASLTGYTRIVGGSLTLGERSAFATELTVAQVDGGLTHVERMAGTFRRSGGELELTIPAGVVATATAEGGELRVTSTADRMVYVYGH